MRKHLSAALIFLLLFSASPVPEADASYNEADAKAYLKAHNDNPWSVMALVALGESSVDSSHLASVGGINAIDYAAPILAITSLGHDPRVFAEIDYVDALKSNYSQNQIGDPQTLNDDFFGIMALISSGEPADDAVIADSRNFILSHQNGDGGWGFTISSGSDTNMTAAGILSLLSSGIESSDLRIQNALSFLLAFQNDDGGFSYYSGAASDSSSTAWAIWAFNALGIDSGTLVKSGENTPLSYLESNQSGQGFFKFQSGSQEDSFSAITTAYAVIALEGKKLPLSIIQQNSEPTPKSSFRIEGKDETVCSGEVFAATALDIIEKAKNLCDFEYEIENSSWGAYLKRINNDQASGMTGWLYMVNDISPFVGAAEYELEGGDFTLWYFGEFGWQLTKLSLSAEQIGAGQSVTAYVEFFDGSSWLPLSGASVYFGAKETITDSSGQALASLEDGYFKVYAQKQGYVRSNSVLLKVGQPASSSVDMTATIEQGNVKGDETGGDTISFVVSPDNLDFGKLGPGSSSVKGVTINNNGNVDIHMEALVSGDSLFVNGIDLNDVYWKNFKTEINKESAQSLDVKLSVPAGYADESGVKAAQLTFWAIAG